MGKLFLKLYAVFVLAALFTTPAPAAIVYISESSGSNNALPTNNTAGPLTIPIPAGVTAGRTLIASIAARPRNMVVTVPTGWVLMTSTQQQTGGVSTGPGGMNLLTYYKIATVSEPASYTWTFRNPVTGQGGGVVGGILAFSGVDTSTGIPIDNSGTAWSALCTGSNPDCATGYAATNTHGTTSFNTVTANTMIVSSISYLSASTFGNPTGIPGLVERLDVSAPTAAAAIGTTLQMATAPKGAPGATGTSTATAAGNFQDSGIGHLMALRPSAIDLSLGMTRSGPLVPGNPASYTLTVTNTGFSTEPGPLTIVDTLPAGLTYVSATGSGWSCSPSGQTITCTRTGALLAGATAPTLTLNVNVNVGASGTQTNTATVSGTGGDGDLSDNTAVDSYTIPTPTYAYYAMDETNWGASPATGQVIDSSGNNRHAGTFDNITTLATPAAGLKGDTCRGTNIPDNNALATVAGMETPIDINDLGNAGSISFWYRSRLDWDPPGNSNNDDRTLFDATPSGGNGEFWFVLENDGRLYFRLDNSGNQRQNVRTNGYTRAANTWVHLAATWNFTTGSMCIYVDGVADPACVTGDSNINSTNNYINLLVGDNRGNYTNNPNRGYSADGDIDELRIYALELNAGQVAADMNASHPCVSINNFAINIGAAAASTCNPKNVTITARDALNNTLTSYLGTVDITTSNNHGDWSQSPVTGTLVNGTANDGAATYTFAAGDNGVKTLALTNHHADDLTITVVDNGIPATASTSSTINFRDNAFVITNDVIQVAGRNQAMSAAMWRRDLTTGDCAIATGYTGNKNLDAWLTLDPSHPAGATVPTIGALTLPTTAPAVNPGSNNLALTFVNGSVNFNLSTTDVGKYVFNLRDDTRTFANAVDILGTSNAITTRPFALAVSAVQSGATNNPNGANPTDPVFIAAGANFEATIGAYRYNAAADGNNDGLPDATATLAQTTANGLALRFNATATLTRSAAGFTPAGGTLGTLSNATFSSFVGGTQTRTDLNYTEVGSFLFDSAAPLVTNYLGTAGVNLVGTFFNAAGSQTNATRVGRFIPAYFDVIPTQHGCAGSAFTYSGQPFRVTVRPFNALAAQTLNYTGALGFSKDVTISDPNGATNCPSGTCFANNSIAASQFSNSGGTVSGSTHPVTNPLGGPNPPMTYRFVVKETPPLMPLALRAIDTENVSSQSHVEGSTEIRSGRLRLYNAYGSELMNLSLPMKAEFYQDTAGPPATTGWITNGADSCTVVAVAQLDLTNNVHVPPPGPGQGVATINIKVGPDVPSTVTVVSPTSGVGELRFSAPGPGGNGYADARLDLTGLPWMLFNWDDAGPEDDPTGRATFGLYRGSPRHIFLRERN